jgi:preprotein translocase subunit Sss1
MPSPEKTVEDIVKQIEELPPDMKTQVLEKLKTIKINDPNSRKLATLNKEFSDIYSYKKRLQITSKKPITNYKTPINEVVKTIGHVPLKTILETSPVKKELKTIFDINNILDYNKDFDAALEENTLKEAKEIYKKNTEKTDFDKQQEEWEKRWNYENSDPTKLNHLQTKIKRFYPDIIKFDDKQENLESVNQFLDLTPKNTYKEYITSLKNLPLGAKGAVGI